MWVVKLKIKNPDKIFTPLCKKYECDMVVVPTAYFIKINSFHFFARGIVTQNQDKIVASLKGNKSIQSIVEKKNILFIALKTPIHSFLPLTKETNVFFDEELCRTKPIIISQDGWNYWEISSFNRDKLNGFIRLVKKYWQTKILSLKDEKLNVPSPNEILPFLSKKQFSALMLAMAHGYYVYPRKNSLEQIAKINRKSYGTFHEQLRTAENKIMNYFLVQFR